MRAEKREQDPLRRKGPPRDRALWWSKRKYYTVEALRLGYTLFWLWGWYGLVYRPVFPLWVRVLIAVFPVFTKMEAPFFQSYEKAMNRYRKAEGLPDEYYEEFPWSRDKRAEVGSIPNGAADSPANSTRQTVHP